MVWKFGNPAPLSTFSYESFYKFSLSGFNPQLTTGFLETAAIRFVRTLLFFSTVSVCRVLLHVSLRREVMRRAEENPDADLEAFLKETPDLRPFQMSWSHRLFQLTAEEASLSSGESYGCLHLSYGKLISNYSKNMTTSDYFFSEDDTNGYSCHRFVCVTIRNAQVVGIIAEPVRELPRNAQFDTLQLIETEMRGTSFETSASHLLTHARVYKGLVHGRLSEKRVVLPLTSLKGFAARMEHQSASYYLQVNGTPVHN